MDYYQGVVAQFLDSDRSVFLNTECFIQMQRSPRSDKGSSWYCDILAVNLRESAAYLCEVTFSADLRGLLKRLSEWDACWPQFCKAIQRDCSIPETWPIRPWVFIPADRVPILRAKHRPTQMPEARVTPLESVVPWKYSSDGRLHDAILEEMPSSPVRKAHAP